MDFVPTIAIDKCIGCEICIKICSNDVLSLIDNVAVVTQPEACSYSGLCQDNCPTGAIQLVYEILFQISDDAPAKGGGG